MTQDMNDPHQPQQLQNPQQPYQPYQQGPYPPPGYPVAQQPAKKHTLRNVFIVLSVLFVLGVGGCVAFVAAVGNEVSKDLDSEVSRNVPRDVSVGRPFTIGKHETATGWKVQNEVGMFTVVGKVKNVSDATSTAFIHFKFLAANGEVLGNVQCNSSDLEPGQTQELNCIPDGKYQKWAKVTAEATF